MKKICFVLIITSIHQSLFSQVFRADQPLVHTFSIVARDASSGEMGVAVQSHWFSVGTAVSWAEAGVGAVATQSFVNKSFGMRGLALLKDGLTAQEALDKLLSDDDGRDVRQVAIIDTKGNVATHTGKKCIDFATQIKGEGYSVQSNMMLTNKVSKAMSAAFEKSKGKVLAERLILSLEAAQQAGGDIRGQQSAAILVVPGKSEGKPWDERTVDLRVDDSPTPIRDLRRLYNIQVAYEHMNNGDLQVEKNNMTAAMKEYNDAMKMFPQNLEMQYWTAITLANNKQVGKALPILKRIFVKENNWKELTRRLPKVGLLTVSEADLNKILGL